MSWRVIWVRGTVGAELCVVWKSDCDESIERKHCCEEDSIVWRGLVVRLGSEEASGESGAVELCDNTITPTVPSTRDWRDLPQSPFPAILGCASKYMLLARPNVSASSDHAPKRYDACTNIVHGAIHCTLPGTPGCLRLNCTRGLDHERTLGPYLQSIVRDV